jgi:hypothetical protein
MVKEHDFLDERTRAEDILLGALGFDTEAKIVKIEIFNGGYRGQGRWSDGEDFDFQSDDEVSDLEKWALTVITKQ